jgi:hypothetical protein
MVGIVFILGSFEPALTQIRPGEREFSLAASYSSRKFENDDESWTALNIAARAGFFMNRHVEIEPEILFSKYKEQDAGFILSGNIAYNFKSRGAEKTTIPFIMGGLGYANTLLFLPNIASSGAEDENWTVINAGGGVKLLISDPVAVRIEYRFQKFSGDEDATYHNVYIGFSMFL